MGRRPTAQLAHYHFPIIISSRFLTSNVAEFRKQVSFCICLFEVQIININRECMRGRTKYLVIKRVYNNCKQECCLLRVNEEEKVITVLRVRHRKDM